MMRINTVKTSLKKVFKKAIALGCLQMPSRIQRIVAKTAQYILHILNADPSVYSPALYGRLSIAVAIEGGMGDSIIALAWLKELHRHLDTKADIYVYGRVDCLPAVTLLSAYVTRVLDISLYALAGSYDLKLSIAHFVCVDEANIPGIAAKNSKLIEIIKNLRMFNDLHAKYVHNRPHYDGAWADYCTLQGWNRWDELGANGAIPFSRKNRGAIHLALDAFPVLNTHGLSEQPFITIHAGGDTRLHTASQGMKIWPVEYWGQFCRLFKERYPHIRIIQLGEKNHGPIPGADVILCGKATLYESAVVLKHAMLHIDGESGLVHLRHQLGGKSVVLFGPTPEKYFAYENNVNIVSSECGNCMWKSNEWWKTCVRGLSRQECMWAITPEHVFASVCGSLDDQNTYTYSLHSPALYSSLSHTRRQSIVDDICSSCSMVKKPISEHIFGPGRTYIHASKQWEYPYAIEAVNAMGSEPLRIADVGGGRGVLAWYLSTKGHDVTVYDVNYLWDSGDDPDVENRFFRFARNKGFGADFGSVFNIPAEDDSFDVVTCISVVEHIPRKEYALKEMLRVLKPGGILILTYDLVPGKPIQRDALRVEIFTPHMITAVLQKFGIPEEEIHSVDDIRRSMGDVLSDNVNIAPGMTVGGLVIRKKFA